MFQVWKANVGRLWRPCWASSGWCPTPAALQVQRKEVDGTTAGNIILRHSSAAIPAWGREYSPFSLISWSVVTTVQWEYAWRACVGFVIIVIVIIVTALWCLGCTELISWTVQNTMEVHTHLNGHCWCTADVRVISGWQPFWLFWLRHSVMQRCSLTTG